MEHVHVVDRPSPLRQVLANHLVALGHDVEVSSILPDPGTCPGVAADCLLIAAQQIAAHLPRQITGTPGGAGALIVLVDDEDAGRHPVYPHHRLLGTLSRPFPLAVLEWLLRIWQREQSASGRSKPAGETANRRRSLRVPSCQSATLLWRGTSGMNSQGGVLRDISLHGAGVRLVGSGGHPTSRLDVLMPLADRRTLRLAGRTVRVSERGRGRELGIEWGPMTPSQRSAMASLFV